MAFEIVHEQTGSMSAEGLTRPPTKLVKLRLLHYRYTLPRAIKTTMGPLSCRPALILRIEDEQGAFGWGEIWCNFPPGGDLYRAHLALCTLPAVLAQANVSGNFTFHDLHQKLQRLSLQAGEPGPVAQLCAGVDIAVHDLQVRRAGICMADSLTVGKPTDSVRRVNAYASGISPDNFEQQIDTMRSRGFRHFKVRIGFGTDDSLPQLRAASSGLQDGETLMTGAVPDHCRHQSLNWRTHDTRSHGATRVAAGRGNRSAT